MTEYGRAKTAAEHLVRTIAPGALIVRTSLIYGGPDGPSSPREDLARDPTATFYEDEVRCPVQVGDLADAAWSSWPTATSPACSTWPGRRPYSRHRFAELITGHPVRHAPAPAGRPLDCRLDTSPARRHAGDCAAWRQ